MEQIDFHDISVYQDNYNMTADPNPIIMMKMSNNEVENRGWFFSLILRFYWAQKDAPSIRIFRIILRSMVRRWWLVVSGAMIRVIRVHHHFFVPMSIVVSPNDF